MPGKKTVPSFKLELLQKARDAALCAIKTYNDPLITFKTEAFIVLMVVAWTYLMHAHCRAQGVDYRYYTKKGKRKQFDRTKRGAIKYWELERCLNDAECPLDAPTIKNLKFLIELRHEIEHQMSPNLDNFLSGRYQACAMNFNHYARTLFGEKHSLNQYLSYSIQLASLDEKQVNLATRPDMPPNIRAFIEAFDAGMPEDEFNDSRFSYRLLFTKKLANKPGQADAVIEFIDPKSDLAKEIDKQYWVKKDVERKKFRPSDVVAKVNEAGFAKFRVSPEHVTLWKSEGAKNPAKGFGVEVAGQWYWYEKWVQRCIELCALAGNKYK
jgi:hypothetical protein